MPTSTTVCRHLPVSQHQHQGQCPLQKAVISASASKAILLDAGMYWCLFTYNGVWLSPCERHSSCLIISCAPVRKHWASMLMKPTVYCWYVLLPSGFMLCSAGSQWGWLFAPDWCLQAAAEGVNKWGLLTCCTMKYEKSCASICCDSGAVRGGLLQWINSVWGCYAASVFVVWLCLSWSCTGSSVLSRGCCFTTLHFMQMFVCAAQHIQLSVRTLCLSLG